MREEEKWNEIDSDQEEMNINKVPSLMLWNKIWREINARNKNDILKKLLHISDPIEAHETAERILGSLKVIWYTIRQNLPSARPNLNIVSLECMLE